MNDSSDYIIGNYIFFRRNLFYCWLLSYAHLSISSPRKWAKVNFYSRHVGYNQRGGTALSEIHCNVSINLLQITTPRNAIIRHKLLTEYRRYRVLRSDCVNTFVYLMYALRAECECALLCILRHLFMHINCQQTKITNMRWFLINVDMFKYFLMNYVLRSFKY